MYLQIHNQKVQFECGLVQTRIVVHVVCIYAWIANWNQQIRDFTTVLELIFYHFLFHCTLHFVCNVINGKKLSIMGTDTKDHEK